MRTRLLVMWAAVCLASNLCFATWDVAADFSTTNNPNGVWSYGWSSLLTSDLNLYPNHGKFDDKINPIIPIDVWAGSNFPYTPNVTHNGTGSKNTDHPTIVWETGQFALHPGDDGEYSHACWTAPNAGNIYIDAVFTGIDTHGTTTDVHVIHHDISNDNDISLFDGDVNGWLDTSSFSKTISVGMGDIIDFAVGDGGNDHTCDTTALSATIPEPTSAILIGVGFLFAHLRRRQR